MNFDNHSSDEQSREIDDNPGFHDDSASCDPDPSRFAGSSEEDNPNSAVIPGSGGFSPEDVRDSETEIPPAKPVQQSALFRAAAFMLGVLLMAGTVYGGYTGFLRPSPVQEITLYFSDFRHTHIVPVQRVIHRIPSLPKVLKRVLLELCYGPVSNDALPSVPVGTRLLGSWLHEGTAYADFSRELYLGLTVEGGAEIAAVRAIVATVLRNVPGVRRVQILVEGRRFPTLRGLTRILDPLSAAFAGK